MKFLNLNGKNRVMVNLEKVTVVEETNGGCKFYLSGTKEAVTTDIKYDDLIKIIERTWGN